MKISSHHIPTTTFIFLGVVFYRLMKNVACARRSDDTLKILINDRVPKLDYLFPHHGDYDTKALTSNKGTIQRVILLP